MHPRAFAPDLDPSQPTAALSAEESAHLVRVLRLGAGARVLVFDGRGTQFLARVATAAKDSVTLSLLEPVAAAPEPRVRLTLAQALLKGDKMDAVMRNATMMGVAAVIPLITERTVIPKSAVELGRVRERWHRVAVASAKQCGRAFVPEIGPPERLEALLEAQTEPDVLRLQLVEPAAAAAEVVAAGRRTGGAEAAARLGTRAGARAAAGTGAEAEAEAEAEAGGRLPAEPSAAGTLIAIGPEGGWSAEEVAAAKSHGWLTWTLGARTLRAESAPLAALSVLTYAWRL